MSDLSDISSPLEEDYPLITEHQKNVLDQLREIRNDMRDGWVARCALKHVKDKTLLHLTVEKYLDTIDSGGIRFFRYSGKHYTDIYDDPFIKYNTK